MSERRHALLGHRAAASPVLGARAAAAVWPRLASCLGYAVHFLVSPYDSLILFHCVLLFSRVFCSLGSPPPEDRHACLVSGSISIILFCIHFLFFFRFPSFIDVRVKERFRKSVPTAIQIFLFALTTFLYYLL